MPELPIIQMQLKFVPGGYEAYSPDYDFEAKGWDLDTVRWNAALAANRKVCYMRRITADDIVFAFSTGG